MGRSKAAGVPNVIDIGTFKSERGGCPTITIRLMKDGSVNYETDKLSDEHAFQALVGCYIVAGQMLKNLKEMKG